MAQGATIIATCATCQFYRPLQPTQGECREGSPMPFVFPGPPNIAGQPQIVTRGLWPPVGIGEYCGKHPMFGARLVEDVKIAQPTANGATAEPARDPAPV